MQREKFTIVPTRFRKIFFSLPDPKDNKIKGEITVNPVETLHKCLLHGLMGASIIQMIERVNVIFIGGTHKENDR